MLVGRLAQCGGVVCCCVGFLKACHPLVCEARCRSTLSHCEFDMKRASILLTALLSAVLAVPAQANGYGHGGWRGGHHGGHGHRGSWGNHWVAPVLGAAIVGGAIYAATTPSYAMPGTVVVQQQYLPPSRVAYFCPTSQQYYPNVPTCQVPWQPVSY